ncbi:MAG: DUF5615 family PIN-like protein [Actinomycetota bacterium]
MRILLDESVPRRLKALLAGHEVVTVRDAGWASFSNGELLTRASQVFDALVTADQKMPHQQNLTRFDIAVVVLVAKTNTMVDYEPLALKLRTTVESATAGAVSWVSA